jgi:hypothetical protein
MYSTHKIIKNIQSYFKWCILWVYILKFAPSSRWTWIMKTNALKTVLIILVFSSFLSFASLSRHIKSPKWSLIFVYIIIMHSRTFMTQMTLNYYNKSGKIIFQFIWVFYYLGYISSDKIMKIYKDILNDVRHWFIL